MKLMNKVLKEIETSDNLLHLYWMKGYCRSCFDTRTIDKHEYKTIEKALNHREQLINDGL